MLKHTLTYKNFNDEEVTEDFYFNLTESEIVELEVSIPGGIEKGMQRAISTEDNAAIVEFFKAVINKAYGVRSEDGRKFKKNEEIRQEFESSGAYNALFVYLFTGDDPEEKASTFINGLVPQQATNQMPLPLNGQPTVPRRLTEAEVREMDGDEFRSGLASGKYIYP